MPDTEIWFDESRGVVAIGWPNVPGYVFYEAGNPTVITTAFTLPAGMVRMVAAPEPRAACATTRTVPLVPRQRAPRGPRLAEGA